MTLITITMRITQEYLNVNPENTINHDKRHNLITIITIQLCTKVILGNASYEHGVKARLERKTHTGGRNDRNKELSGTNLRKARLSACFWRSNNEPQKIKSQPKLPTALHRYTARCAAHGNRISDKN